VGCSEETLIDAHAFPWYAIRLRSNFERRATDILDEKGFTTFLPVTRARRKWSDRVKEIDVPVFSGYTFCKFDRAHRLPILTTPGVVSILESTTGPIPIPEDEIEGVRRLVNSGLPIGAYPFLQAGESVIVERGPLAGTEGEIISLKNKYRLVVSVSLLQRSVSVEIDRDCVRPTSSRIRHPHAA